jgi:hypothetical protein
MECDIPGCISCYPPEEGKPMECAVHEECPEGHLKVLDMFFSKSYICLPVNEACAD